MKFSAAILSALLVALPLAAAVPVEVATKPALIDEIVTNINVTDWRIGSDLDYENYVEEKGGLEERANAHKLYHHRRSEWVDGWGKRWRTEFYVKPNTVDDHMRFCKSWKEKGIFVLYSNFKCGWDTKLKIWRADVTMPHPPVGWNYFKESRKRALDEWRARTKGKVYTW